MSKQIRTRFAPSPTGQLHIGNARTAIMNWLYARHMNGKFILRIEDTDQERSTAESEKAILDDMKWMGLDWDEGPITGGDYGPYRQSERMERYRSVLKSLLDSGKAYTCFCLPEELESRRKEQLRKGESAHYDGRCRDLSQSDKEKFEHEGRKPSFRFELPEGEVKFQDLVKGEVRWQTENMGDYIIVRPDGMPMYNFACVVDDHDMAISHVIRGDDHVSNTPRQVLLYQALQWKVPAFAHIPMILGQDRERLSKRHGATSVSQYQEAGYLPEALVNFLSLLSWSSESGEEILSIRQLIEEFDFSRVSRSAAVFDVEKLNWMNGMYIRQMNISDLTQRLKPMIEASPIPSLSDADIERIASIFQDKLERLSEINEKASILFQDSVSPENDEAVDILNNEEVKVVFNAFLNETNGLDHWDGEKFKEILKTIQKSTGAKGKHLWMPVRVALTGQMHGPDLPQVASFLGLEKCRRFVSDVLNKK